MSNRPGTLARREVIRLVPVGGIVGLAGCSGVLDSDGSGADGGEETGNSADGTDEDTSEPARFVLDVVEAESPVTYGESVAFEVEVRNDGDESATQSIRLLDVDEEVVDRTEVTLEGRETASRELTLPPEGYDSEGVSAISSTVTVASDADEVVETIEVEPALELTDHETEEVDESGALLLSATVTNTTDREVRAVLVGEIDINTTHEARRPVTVPANQTVSVDLKVTHGNRSGFYSYSDDARLIPYRGETPTPTGADALVVRTFDPEGGEGTTVVVSATVENITDEPRSATLAARMSSSEALPRDFVGEREVSVEPGDSEEFDVEIEYESDQSFFAYSTSTWIKHGSGNG